MKKKLIAGLLFCISGASAHASVPEAIYIHGNGPDTNSAMTAFNRAVDEQLQLAAKNSSLGKYCIAELEPLAIGQGVDGVQVGTRAKIYCYK